MQYNTQQLAEIRKQIFPRLLGSVIISEDKIANGMILNESNLGHCINWDRVKLQLIPLSSVTYEEAIEVSEMLFGSVTPATSIQNGREFVYGIENDFISDEALMRDYIYAIQYLQLKGYALPQLVIIDGKPVTLSVDQLVELGIIELTK